MSGLFQEVKLPSGRTYQQPIGFFVDNEFVASTGDVKCDAIDPSTGKLIVSTIEPEKDKDVDKAVNSSLKAFQTWKDISGRQRRALLLKLADLIEQDEYLVEIDSYNTGKTLSSTKYEVIALVESLRYFAGWADKLHGQASTFFDHVAISSTDYPYGIVNIFLSTHSPLLAFALRIGALAVGNTIIIKPWGEKYLSILYLAQLFVKAGFPPGVITVLHGAKLVGVSLSKHPLISVLTLSGEPVFGALIAERGASTLKKVRVDSNSKNCALITSDADLNLAIPLILKNIFFSNGQGTCAISRIIAHETIYEEVLSRLADGINKEYQPGDPFKEGVRVGTVSTKERWENAQKYIKLGIDEGLRLVTGGLGLPEDISKDEKLRGGYYVRPTLFADVPLSSRLSQEIIPGPIIVVTKHKTFDGAAELVNGVPYTMSCSIFVKRIARAHRFALRVSASAFNINMVQMPTAHFPVTSLKNGGKTPELGEEAYKAYTYPKVISLNIEENQG